MKILNIIPILFLSLPITAQDNLDSFFNDADAFLKTYIENGLVRYTAIQKNKAQLDKLINTISSASVAKNSANEKKAFYINAYNILVISKILKLYPIKSPTDVKDFFSKQDFTVAGQKSSLDDIEHKILRPTYKDARLHFVLVCAAKGCPKIASFAFKPAIVEQQIQQQTLKNLSDTEFIQTKDTQKKVLISEIFKWYEQDFIDDAKSVRNFLNKYIKIPSDYSLGYYNYNWALNEKK